MCDKIINISTKIQRCNYSAILGASRCIEHFYNKQCPICLEERAPGPQTQEDQFLGCNHWLHRICCLGLNEIICPLCKSPMINLDSELLGSIEQNKRKKLTDTALEDSREQARITREIMNRYIMTEIPDGEVLAAVNFMVKLGIPLEILPHNIILTIDPNSFYERGYILQSVAVAMMKFIIKNTFDSEQEPKEETPEEVAENLNVKELFEPRAIDIFIETRPSPSWLSTQTPNITSDPRYKRLFYKHRYTIENA